MENIRVNQQVQRKYEKKEANKCIFIITIFKNESCAVFPFILSKIS